MCAVWHTPVTPTTGDDTSEEDDHQGKTEADQTDQAAQRTTPEGIQEETTHFSALMS